MQDVPTPVLRKRRRRLMTKIPSLARVLRGSLMCQFAFKRDPLFASNIGSDSLLVQGCGSIRMRRSHGLRADRGWRGRTFAV
jgi:hypothetical protein